MKGPLGQYCKRHVDPKHESWHSQHGEYGILEFLTKQLGIEKGWCCEFGAEDGKTYSNTLQFIERGWDAVYVEPLSTCWQSLRSLADCHPKLYVFEGAVADGPVHDNPRVRCLDRILDDAGAPNLIDVLSLDIEGGERTVWQGMQNHRSRIVIIEINSLRPENMWPTYAVGRSLGYTLLGHCGNLVFVRDEDVPQLGIDPRELRNPSELFTPNESDW